MVASVYPAHITAYNDVAIVSSQNIRSGLIEELGKNSIEYQDETVEDFILKPLRLVPPENQSSTKISNDSSFIEQVAKALRDKCKEDFSQLQILSEKTERKKEATSDETAMYPPLNNIIAYINKACENKYPLDSDRVHHRCLVCCSNRPPQHYDPTHNPFPIKPDFLLVETAPRSATGDEPKQPLEREESVYWWQCPAYMEVKAVDPPFPLRTDDPNPPRATKTLGQNSDYARAILSSRPFQLYVLGIAVWKASFCFTYFDRSGVKVSKPRDFAVDVDLHIFIRAVIRFTWEMTPEDLGHDPTVSLLPGSTWHDRSQDYPRFAVRTMDEAVLETIGAPLFSSRSLLGRGTSVFPVISRKNGGEPVEAHILKSSWRDDKRTSEGEIYQRIVSILKDNTTSISLPRVPRAIAKLERCRDVQFAHPGPGLPISTPVVRDSRNGIMATGSRGQIEEAVARTVNLGCSNKKLHRGEIMDFGESLHSYRDTKELGEALLCILEVLDQLHDLGILHRDISPGNMYIRRMATYPPPPGTGKSGRNPGPVITPVDTSKHGSSGLSGFLADFEFASIPALPTYNADPDSPTKRVNRHIRYTTNTGPRQDSPTSPKPGPRMTGTPTFMATEVLVAIRDDLPLTRTRYHDLESFIWVVLYVIYQRYVRRDTGAEWTYHPKLLEEKRRLFSASEVAVFISQRRDSFLDTTSTAGGLHYLIAYLGRLEESENTPTRNVRFAVRLLWEILLDLQPVKKDIPVIDMDQSEEWQEVIDEMHEIGIEVDKRGKGFSDGRTDGEGVGRGERERDIAGGIRKALKFLVRSP
ncbi:hypothetical protein C8Q79DRAFT_327555 [Trametes meyenii]|nr:hypothetical protein C8Q79DRAFT_327555 [Trametes meyenii]